MEPETKHHHLIEAFRLPPLTKHPDADTLSVVKIPETEYTYVAKTSEWEATVGEEVAWIPPESLVDVSRPEFAWLANEAKYNENSEKDKLGRYYRVRAKKIRGVQSYGIMVKLPNIALPANLNEYLGVIHFEAPANTGGNKNGIVTSNEVTTPPSGNYPKYDVESFMKYGRKIFKEGEAVYVTEKVHGANSRYTYKDGQMYCGSRTEWKKEFPSPPTLTLEELTVKVGDEARAKQIYDKAVTNFKPTKNMWWKALDNTPGLKEFCEEYQGWCVYGEVYGQVQNLTYGARPGEIWFAAFDILKPNGQWCGSDEFIACCQTFGIPTVPVISSSLELNFEQIINLASGASWVPGANHYREGIVVKPVKERYHEHFGRVMAKIISPEYLEKN
jgi:RNA ligase (TIGR02306 family)